MALGFASLLLVLGLVRESRAYVVIPDALMSTSIPTVSIIQRRLEEMLAERHPGC